MTIIRSTRQDWLLDAGRLEAGDRVEVFPKEDLTTEAAQAAVDAQYGKDTLIRCWVHGNRFTAFIHPDDESRKRFDVRRADELRWRR